MTCPCKNLIKMSLQRITFFTRDACKDYFYLMVTIDTKKGNFYLVIHVRTQHNPTSWKKYSSRQQKPLFISILEVYPNEYLWRSPWYIVLKVKNVICYWLQTILFVLIDLAMTLFKDFKQGFLMKYRNIHIEFMIIA